MPEYIHRTIAIHPMHSTAGGGFAKFKREVEKIREEAGDLGDLLVGPTMGTNQVSTWVLTPLGASSDIHPGSEWETLAVKFIRAARHCFMAHIHITHFGDCPVRTDEMIACNGLYTIDACDIKVDDPIQFMRDIADEVSNSIGKSKKSQSPVHKELRQDKGNVTTLEMLYGSLKSSRRKKAAPRKKSAPRKKATR